MDIYIPRRWDGRKDISSASMVGVASGWAGFLLVKGAWWGMAEDGLNLLLDSSLEFNHLSL